jgi:hypothetical protein
MLYRFARPLLVLLLAIALLEPAIHGGSLLAQGHKPAASKKTVAKKQAPAKSSKTKAVAARSKPGKTVALKKTAPAKKVAVSARTTAHTKPAPKKERVAVDKPKKQPAPPRRAAVPVEETIVADTTYVEELADGIAHRWVMTNGRQVANVVTIDLKAGARLRTCKAQGRCDGLQTALDIGRSAPAVMPDTVFAATNASFWRAGSNTPIGATVTGGEVVELPGYKLWSSLLLFEDGTAAIDRITLGGEVFWRKRHFQVAGVNRRGESNGLVVYNGFYGDSLPHGSRKSDSAIIAEAFANRVDASSGDDTEGSGIDTAAAIRGYRQSKLLEDREHPILKLACVPVPPRRKRDPLPGPVVGDTMRLIVTRIDTGVVAMPPHGYVLSLGDAAEWFEVVQEGDTIGLLYTITPAQPKRVRELLTGTPRLVRDGHADPEYEVEGSKAKRFIDGKLARTAVGISRDGDTLILATVNSPSTSQGTTGMNLEQLAAFMRSMGAYQAMNFDGGGSASMALNGMMVSRQGDHPSTRRVSNALMAVKIAKSTKAPRRAKAAEALGRE